MFSKMLLLPQLTCSQ